MKLSVRSADVHQLLLGVAAMTAVLLLVPAVAMQFTSEVAWGPGDFVAAAGLLMLAGSALVLGLRAVPGRAGRAALTVGIVSLLGLTWAELAVGLFR